MGVEAVIFFDPAHARAFELRRKRGAHLFSKHRYLSAQMAAYLRDDLWRDLATTANDRSARLARGLRDIARFRNDAQANMIFADLPRVAHRRAIAAGARYHLSGDLDGEDPHQMLTARLVCDWSVTCDDIDGFLKILNGA